MVFYKLKLDITLNSWYAAFLSDPRATATAFIQHEQLHFSKCWPLERKNIGTKKDMTKDQHKKYNRFFSATRS
jgi:hypothetical protein